MFFKLDRFVVTGVLFITSIPNKKSTSTTDAEVCVCSENRPTGEHKHAGKENNI